MNFTPDLHLHTTASDGIYTPAQVVFMAKKQNVNCLAITDHDTMSGVMEGKEEAEKNGLLLLPAVEISTEGDDEVHILGYGVDPDSEKLQELFLDMKQEREKRFRLIGRRLEEIGLPLPMDEILEAAGDSIGRPHIARAMKKMGYISTQQEAFQKYIGKGCPAYVAREKRPASQIIELLRSEKAIPVLAHPALLHWPVEKLLPMLKCWQKHGLMGIEVYHPGNRAEYGILDQMARDRGLLVTGGSDYHDGSAGHGQIGETVREWRNASEDTEKLMEAIKRQKQI